MDQTLKDILNEFNILINSNLIELNRNSDIIQKIARKLNIRDNFENEYILFHKDALFKDIPMYGKSDRSKLKEGRKVLFLCQKTHRNKTKTKN